MPQWPQVVAQSFILHFFVFRQNFFVKTSWIQSGKDQMHFRANSHDVCCWKMFVPKPMSSKASKCQEFMTMFGHETSFEVESNKCCGTVAWCAVHTLQSFPAVFVLFMKYFPSSGHNPLTWCCGVGFKIARRWCR